MSDTLQVLPTWLSSRELHARYSYSICSASEFSSLFPLACLNILLRNSTLTKDVNFLGRKLIFPVLGALCKLSEVVCIKVTGISVPCFKLGTLSALKKVKSMLSSLTGQSQGLWNLASHRLNLEKHR